MFMNPVAYVRQVREELTKVTWPTRREAMNMTLIVVGVSVAVGVYIGGLDSIFTSALDLLLKK